MEDLIKRLEAAEVGSRELDCEIAVLLGGFYICTPRYEGAPPAYGYVDEDGARIEPGHGGTQMVPHYTTSLDAALALAERVLRGWLWQVTTITTTIGGIRKPFAVVMNPGDDNDDIRTFGEAATPALALCIAILRAKQIDTAQNPR